MGAQHSHLPIQLGLPARLRHHHIIDHPADNPTATRRLSCQIIWRNHVTDRGQNMPYKLSTDIRWSASAIPYCVGSGRATSSPAAARHRPCWRLAHWPGRRRRPPLSELAIPVRAVVDRSHDSISVRSSAGKIKPGAMRFAISSISSNITELKRYAISHRHLRCQPKRHGAVAPALVARHNGRTSTKLYSSFQCCQILRYGSRFA